MLKCNNCGELNPVEAVQCQNCQMPDKLTPIISIPKIEETEMHYPTISCMNCGAQTIVTEGKCQHCAFPLPNNVLEGAEKQQQPVVKHILRTA